MSGHREARAGAGRPSPTPGEPPAPRVSGAVILNQIEALVAAFGRGKYEAALARLPEGPRREVAELLAISWIPTETARRLKDNLAELVGLTSSELQVRVVRMALGQTINVFWRLLLRNLSDEGLVRRTPLLYSKTFDRGELTVRAVSPGRAEFELSGWPAMPDYEALGLSTGIACVLEHSGRKGASVRWARAGDQVRFEATWPRGRGGEGPG